MPVWPRTQLAQRPHAMLNGVETMSPEGCVCEGGQRDASRIRDRLRSRVAPFLRNWTSLPTSSTMPVISWPRTRPDGAVVRPRTMCWSEPQILETMTLSTTACSIFLFVPGHSSFGYGIASTATWFGPVQQQQSATHQQQSATHEPVAAPLYTTPRFVLARRTALAPIETDRTTRESILATGSIEFSGAMTSTRWFAKGGEDFDVADS